MAVHAASAAGVGSVSGRGTKIPHAVLGSKSNNNGKTCMLTKFGILV